MTTLGIETSGQRGSVALIREQTLLGERDLSREGRRHARTLVGEIRSLLNKANLRPSDVSAVAVSIGPGSFTGLRVGVTCAKTWAYATGAIIIAVDTFQAVAEQVTGKASAETVYVISDAQRGDLFVGRYRLTPDGSLIQIGDVQILGTDLFVDELGQRAIVTGPATEKLHNRLANRCKVVVGETAHPQAAAVARIGEQMAGREIIADLWAVEPLYLRKSAAEEKAAQKP